MDNGGKDGAQGGGEVEGSSFHGATIPSQGRAHQQQARESIFLQPAFAYGILATTTRMYEARSTRALPSA